MPAHKIKVEAMAAKKRVYKNISNQKLNLMGHGEVGPGEEITVSEEINNPNFEEVRGSKSKEK